MSLAWLEKEIPLRHGSPGFAFALEMPGAPPWGHSVPSGDEDDFKWMLTRFSQKISTFLDTLARLRQAENEVTKTSATSAIIKEAWGYAREKMRVLKELERKISSRESKIEMMEAARQDAESRMLLAPTTPASTIKPRPVEPALLTIHEEVDDGTIYDILIDPCISCPECEFKMCFKH
ncbi:hypothetical protein QQZ08_007520 [Neonectria magnoliae]|uniref:Uncharacterized protein n=1 Tax=Neonectria magnoliae TaxID=2732573 RepID=A0ABR1HXK2_9HYPO